MENTAVVNQLSEWDKLWAVRQTKSTLPAKWSGTGTVEKGDTLRPCSSKPSHCLQPDSFLLHHALWVVVSCDVQEPTVEGTYSALGIRTFSMSMRFESHRYRNVSPMKSSTLSTTV